MFRTISKLDFHTDYKDIFDISKKKPFKDAIAGDVVCDGNLVVIERRHKQTPDCFIVSLTCIDSNDNITTIERSYDFNGDIF